MICPDCHKPLDSDIRFCIYCGAEIIQPSHAREWWGIGRGPGNEIVFDLPQISYQHARLIRDNAGWILEDKNSTNHTFINDRSKPVRRQQVRPADTVYFGSFKISARCLLAMTKDAAHKTSDAHSISITDAETILGRDPSSSIHLDHPRISWHHARITCKGNRLFLQDLSSTNGTFLNGRKVAHAELVPGDTISLASFSFKLTDDQKLAKRDHRGEVRLDAENITIEVYEQTTRLNKRILNDLTLTIYPSEFVGLMGPSGAGKTTLMLALNGYMPPDYGRSRINGLSIYENYDIFRGCIGYVPQDDIMHTELTVYEALFYTAKIRLPSDTTNQEISTLIDKVLSQLGLLNPEKGIDVRGIIIGSAEKKGISGGERKRVNLAMELLTDPSLLFLDEPTSGLSAQDALVVMDVLRSLSDIGKTIILTIHQPSLEAFTKMDNVIILSSGSLMYYGPAFPDSLMFFNPGMAPGKVLNSMDHLFKGLSSRTEKEWQSEYSKSNYYQAYVRDRKTKGYPVFQAIGDIQRPLPSAHLHQWWCLTRRFFTVKRKDTVHTAILLLQAPIIAILIALVFHGKESPPYSPLFLLAISALWFGTSNSAREIVSEKAIYLRERMVNLKIPSYFFSKYSVLGTLCSIQCFIMVVIVHGALQLKGDMILTFAVTFLAALAGLSIGLFLSSITKTQQAAMAIVPLALLPMIILGGGIRSLSDMNKPTLTLSYLVPSRWSFEQLIHLEQEGRQKEITHTTTSYQDVMPNQEINGVDLLFGKEKKSHPELLLAVSSFVVCFAGLTMAVLKSRDRV
jgi:ABC-type multidrug transport system ATPase subunit/pSer/pThr/pTyr-binding forkhead associated (FHA) protein